MLYVDNASKTSYVVMIFQEFIKHFSTAQWIINYHDGLKPSVKMNFSLQITAWGMKVPRSRWCLLLFLALQRSERFSVAHLSAHFLLSFSVLEIYQLQIANRLQCLYLANVSVRTGTGSQPFLPMCTEQKTVQHFGISFSFKKLNYSARMQ